MHQLIADLADRNQTLQALQGDSQEAGHHPGNLFRWRGLFPVVCRPHIHHPESYIIVMNVTSTFDWLAVDCRMYIYLSLVTEGFFLLDALIIVGCV